MRGFTFHTLHTGWSHHFFCGGGGGGVKVELLDRLTAVVLHSKRHIWLKNGSTIFLCGKSTFTTAFLCSEDCPSSILITKVCPK